MWYSLWGNIEFIFSIKKSLERLGSVVKHRSLKLKSVIQTWTASTFFSFFPLFLSFIFFLHLFFCFFFQPPSLISTLIPLPFPLRYFLPSFLSCLFFPPFCLQITTCSCEKNLKNHLKIGRLNGKYSDMHTEFLF